MNSRNRNKLRKKAERGKLQFAKSRNKIRPHSRQDPKSGRYEDLKTSYDNYLEEELSKYKNLKLVYDE